MKNYNSPIFELRKFLASADVCDGDISAVVEKGSVPQGPDDNEDLI